MDTGGVNLIATSAQSAYGETIYQGASQLAPLAETFGARIASKAFVAFSAFKLAYDGAAYGVAALKCGGVTF